jgi:hypothetical protein
MNLSKSVFLRVSVMMILIAFGNRAAAQYAAAVVSYSAGTTPAGGFTTPSAALDSPERLTGEGMFPSVVSPFSPPYLSSEIVSVGEGGQLTLRLSHYAIPLADGPEIGLFSSFGLIDTVYPNGQAGTPAGGFGPPDSALVEVSANGANWVSLDNVTFDVPTNGYTDLADPFAGAAGSVPSDFQQPFAGSLASFDGLRYYDAGGPDMLELLAGSGGGTWLDISGTGLAQVGYIRFSLADDGSAGTSLNFELDAVSISHAALGAAVVPEPGTLTPALVALSGCAIKSRRRRLRAAGLARSQARWKVRGLGSGSAHQESKNRFFRPVE